ncbi:hypothetical protein PG993_000607 [Apiospora rasikravindrae]|uniref:Uncharacterized protein n=1 Tax=Apiospora rasikravindrae TaxID=990691 RepID=A0ABR1U916_9PEZI
MPRFPVNFRRKSQVTEDHDAPVESSFRVLERTEVGPGKSFDGGARLMKATGAVPKTTLSEITADDNIFANMKSNRGSGSSTTIKTTSDNSSRHSNASTAPSSTDFTATLEDGRNSQRKSVHDTPGHHAQKSSGGSGFLKQAGRTFSFGGSKKNSLPTIPADEPVPSVPENHDPQTPGNRSRAQTGSTITTATPPQLDERDFRLDLGGDLSNMLSAFNKRASVATVKDKDDTSRTPLGSRNLTGNRGNQPSPLHLDKISAVEAPPKSWASQTSNDGLLARGLASPKGLASPPAMDENTPPPVPRHRVHPSMSSRPSPPEDDEDAALLKDTLAATSYLARSGGHMENEDTVSNLRETYSRPTRFNGKSDDDNMFEFGRGSRSTGHGSNRGNGPPQNKVMTPAEFERYQRDKVRQQRDSGSKDVSSSEDEDNYEDEEDDAEKTKEMAKQRRKQEAHMTVYRQQMMKVTGEQPGMAPSRPSLSMSMSTPNLPLNLTSGPSGSNSPPSDASEDEDVPLGILAAHGFPNKNRPPIRLSTVGSNPNLRASMAPSFSVGPGSVAGDNAPRPGGPLPAFARKLPQDPFLGAGLINQPPRESFALGGGAPAQQNRAAPVGGLVGVIANEERQRALRRGSPAIDGKHAFPSSMQMPMNPGMPGGFDPVAGIPAQMMYPQMPVTPGDQAQLQMTQQMTQFMQMQMQFMQMMTGQNTSQTPMHMNMQMPGQGPPRPMSHMPNQSIGSMPDMNRTSFLGDPLTMGNGNNNGNSNGMGMGMGNGTGMNSNMGMESVRGDSAMRTMSMVQPSSSSWIQPPNGGFTPSIRIQGAGYAPSIAPSERSNIGLPGRYRPVSSMAPLDGHSRTQTMSGALPTLSKLSGETKVGNDDDDDDDDEKGWEELKAKREKKKSLWKAKKSFGSELGSLIS